MKNFLVYLAGPISGLTYDQGQDWRTYVAGRLPKEIHAISPLRAKAERLKDAGVLEGSYEDNPLTTSKGINTRDRFDCMRADAVIMNLLGASKVTIGSMIEIGWADAARNPLIIVMEKDNIHRHPMVNECAGYIVETLEQAIAICEAILMPTGFGTPRDNSQQVFPFARELRILPAEVPVGATTYAHPPSQERYVKAPVTPNSVLPETVPFKDYAYAGVKSNDVVSETPKLQ